MIPVYRAIAGIPPKALRATIERALDTCRQFSGSTSLPESIRARYGLCERNFALRNAHFPVSREALSEARRRLAFEELLLYQVALRLIRTVGAQGHSDGFCA